MIFKWVVLSWSAFYTVSFHQQAFNHSHQPNHLHLWSYLSSTLSLVLGQIFSLLNYASLSSKHYLRLSVADPVLEQSPRLIPGVCRKPSVLASCPAKPVAVRHLSALLSLPGFPILCVPMIRLSPAPLYLRPGDYLPAFNLLPPRQRLPHLPCRYRWSFMDCCMCVSLPHSSAPLPDVPGWSPEESQAPYPHISHL